jgi:hypothetical protein
MALIAVAACCGCSGRQSRLAAPGIDRNAGQAAITKYDANGDGALSGDELNKVPAFKASLKRLDSNGDGKVSPDEIAERVAAWRRSQLAITRVVANIRQNQRPLADAQVTLVPEDFLGPAVMPAQGSTDASGSAHLRISASPDEAGVHLGFYRVQVSKKTPDGKEMIPARYNTETELGVEITPDDPNADRITFDVSSR